MLLHQIKQLLQEMLLHQIKKLLREMLLHYQPIGEKNGCSIKFETLRAKFCFIRSKNLKLVYEVIYVD